MNRAPARRALRPLLVLSLLVLSLTACGGGLERGSPMPDAEEVARRARATSGTEEPMHVVFRW
ncbi:MAG: hypothetical protein OXN85_02935, partial [Gemmatimonadetes bacterium]|nr:hypothetical protein [Candidatus Palauibacter australiensis]